jgi:hypothetical protein
VTTTRLFSAQDLTDWLHYPVSPVDAVIAERVVRGWLLGATGVQDWGDPVPPDVFAWAVELGAIAHELPNGELVSTTTGATTDTYGVKRRSQILADAAQRPAGGTVPGRGDPQGAFPPAMPWPQPVDRCY